MVRPKKAESDKRTSVVQLRVTPAERADLQRAADLDRRNLSDWLRKIALDAAADAKEPASRRKSRG